jgi:hypothetical protein
MRHAVGRTADVNQDRPERLKPARERTVCSRNFLTARSSEYGFHQFNSVAKRIIDK